MGLCASSASDVPSIGFGAGLERTLQVMLKQNLYFPPKKAPLLYLIPMGEEALKWAFQQAHLLRRAGISCEVDLDRRKVGKAFARASDLGATWAAAVGDRELANQELELKELKTKILNTIPFASLHETLRNHIELMDPIR